MDAQMVRQQLEEIKESLKKNEEEHGVLLNLVAGYEGWLRIHGFTNGQQPQLSLTVPPGWVTGRGKNQPKGTISFRAAILQVLKEARGAPLHAKEILVRAQKLGAITEGKNPVGLVGLNLVGRTAEGVEQTAPRTWRWKD